jgi:ATP-dependent RNA helicase DHX8/PRP22
MDDLYNLEFLSLVAKITQEIDNFTGLSDKTLAEFVISLHDESKTLPDFKQKLKDVGADFPESFIENMDRLILNMHPKHKKKSKATSNGKSKENGVELSEQEKQKRMFPGLAKPDQEWQPSISEDLLMKEVDDMMSQFEGAAKKAKLKPDASERERSPKRQRRDRSWSPPRRRSQSPPRGRGYGDRRDDRGGQNGYGSRPSVDERPVLFKIYNGRVSGMKDFGAFVSLEGVAGRVEGM